MNLTEWQFFSILLMYYRRKRGVRMYKLRKIIPEEDCILLFELLNLYSENNVFPQKLNFNCFNEFQHWIIEQLAGYYHDFYIIEKRNEPKEHIVQGLILSYDYRVYDAHCKIYGYLPEGINSVILEQFVDLLFKEYPLNKVFLEITDVDKAILDSAAALGFTQEAVLVENKYINGKYHDLIILSLYSKKRRG